MNDVTEKPSRTRMVELFMDSKAESLAGRDIKIRPTGADAFNFFDGQTSWWAEHLVDRIGSGTWNPKRAWTRAARGVAILEQLGTPEAVKVLGQLAEGHADAFPTKAAKQSLERLKKK